MRKVTYMGSTGKPAELIELEDGNFLFLWGNYTIKIDRINTVTVKHYDKLLGRFIASSGVVSVTDKHPAGRVVAVLEAYDTEERSREKHVSLRIGAALITVTSFRDDEVNEVHVVIAVNGKSVVIQGET